MVKLGVHQRKRLGGLINCKVMRKSMLRFRLNRNYGKLEITDLEPQANIWRVGVGSSSVEPPIYGSRTTDRQKEMLSHQRRTDRLGVTSS